MPRDAKGNGPLSLERLDQGKVRRSYHEHRRSEKSELLSLSEVCQHHMNARTTAATTREATGSAGPIWRDPLSYGSMVDCTQTSTSGFTGSDSSKGTKVHASYHGASCLDNSTSRDDKKRITDDSQGYVYKSNTFFRESHDSASHASVSSWMGSMTKLTLSARALA